MSELTLQQRRDAERTVIEYVRAVAENQITIRRNPYREDPRLTIQNINIEGLLGAGSEGEVFQIRNADTGKVYALKLQRVQDLDTKADKDDRDPLATTPTLSASSEAAITSGIEVYRRSLTAKRFLETRAYLRYIKGGHPNITSLEAYFDYQDRDKLRFAHFFELCDGGTLADLLDAYRWDRSKPIFIVRGNEIRAPSPRPPEAFIWHVLYQLIDGLAFLHREHPDYEDDAEYQKRAIISQQDLFPQNVYLKWENPDDYPTIKIGDFGTAIFMRPAGHKENEGGYSHWPCPPPEDGHFNEKTDIWGAGCMAYSLAKFDNGRHEQKFSGPMPTRTNRGVVRKRGRQDPARVQDIDGHLSQDLNDMIHRCLTMNPDQRPSSGQLYRELRPMMQARGQMLYKALPEWVTRADTVMSYEFPPGRIAQLDAGGFEMENQIQEEIDENDEPFMIRALSRGLKREGDEPLSSTDNDEGFTDAYNKLRRDPAQLDKYNALLETQLQEEAAAAEEVARVLREKANKPTEIKAYVRWLRHENGQGNMNDDDITEEEEEEMMDLLDAVQAIPEKDALRKAQAQKRIRFLDDETDEDVHSQEDDPVEEEEEEEEDEEEE